MSRRLKSHGVVHAGLTGQTFKRALGEPRSYLLGDDFQSSHRFVVVSGGDIKHDLNVCSEPGKRLLGHTHTVQHTALYVNGVSNQERKPE